MLMVVWKTVRNVKNFMDELDVDSVWNKLTKQDRNVVCFEFYGSKPYDVWQKIKQVFSVTNWYIFS